MKYFSIQKSPKSRFFFLLLGILVAFIRISSSEKVEFSILHTNDLHSQVLEPNGVAGNFARLKTAAEFLRKYLTQSSSRNSNSPFQKKNVLLLDSGDWFLGTLFHVISAAKFYKRVEPVELNFLSNIMKYDATVLGNHDLESEKVLLHMMKRTHSNENSNLFDSSFPILASNLDIKGSLSSKKATNCAKFARYIRNFEKLEEINKNSTNFSENELNDMYSFPRYFETDEKDQKSKEKGFYMKPFILKKIIDKENQSRVLRIGIFGVFPPDPAVVSIHNRKCLRFHGFNDTKVKPVWNELTNHVVDVSQLLRTVYKADVVVGIGHTGEPEDEKIITLMQEELNERKLGNNGIDIWLSAHTHQKYVKKIENFGKTTYILQSGSYAQFLGVLRASFDFDTKSLEILNYDHYNAHKTSKIKKNHQKRGHRNYNPIPKSIFYLDSLVRYESPSNSSIAGVYKLVPAKNFPAHIPITSAIAQDPEFMSKFAEKYKKILNDHFLGPILGFEYDTNIISLQKFRKYLTIDKKTPLKLNSNTKPRRMDFAELVCEIMMNESCLKMFPPKVKNGAKKDNFSDCHCQEPVMLWGGFENYRIEQGHDIFNENFNSSSDRYFNFGDVFRTVGVGKLSTQIDEAHLPGGPLVLFYVEKITVKMMILIDLVYSRYVNPIFRMSFSRSLTYDVKWRFFGLIPFFSNVRLRGIPIDNYPNKSFPVFMKIDAAKYLTLIPKITRGILDLRLLDSRGKKITDFEEFVRTGMEYTLLAKGLQRIECINPNLKD